MKILKSFIYFLTLSTLFISLPAYAQVTSIGDLNIYEQFNLDERAQPKQYVASDESGHYMLYSLGKKGDGATQLVKFNTNGLPTGQKALIAQKEESLIGAVQIGKNLLCLTSISNENSRKLFARTIELEQFTIGSAKPVATINTSRNSEIEDIHTVLLASQDEQSATLLYEIPQGIGGEKQYAFILFDEDFNFEKQYIYAFPGTNKDFTIANINQLNKEEWIVMLANYKQLPNNSRSQKTRDYGYELFHLQAELMPVSLGKVPNDNKWVNKLKMLIDDESIRLYGLYSIINRYAAHGTFFHKVSRSNPDEVVHRLSPFSDQVIAIQQAHKKIEVSNQNEVSYYIPKQLFSQDNGAALLLSEQLHYYNRLNTSNILAIKINDEGIPEWSQVIRKNNSHSNINYSSYKAISTPDKCVLIYNGDIRNIDPTSPKRPQLAWYSALTQAIIRTEIDLDGNVEQSVLSKYGQAGQYILWPRMSKINTKGEILFFAQEPANIKSQRFLSLDLKLNQSSVSME